MMHSLRVTLSGGTVGTKQQESKKDSIQEFYEALKNFIRNNKIESKLKLYKVFDKNQDGSISFKEFNTFLIENLKVELDNPNLVFNSFDEDKTGQISINEFIKKIEKGSQKFYVNLFKGIHTNVDKIIKYVQKVITQQNVNLASLFQKMKKLSSD